MKINARLGACVAYGFTGGPEWNTLEIPMDNGGVQRNGNWMYPRHRYSAQFQNLKPEAKDEILSAIMVCRGKLNSFLFQDHNDYKLEAAPQAPSIGTATPLQLFKTYTFGGQILSRRITAPRPGTVISRDGTPVTGTWDYLTGKFTPSSNWLAGVYTADGEFDVWCNFAADYNAFTIGNWQAHTADIEIVENKGLD